MKIWFSQRETIRKFTTKIMFFSGYQMMDKVKVQKSSNTKCNISLSEPFRIEICS
jgi:hypothetical protein